MSNLAAVVRGIVEWARLAPSIHNTQPWVWRVEDDQVWLWADRSRMLTVEDPSGRNLTISCGTALHHFWYAARALGWDAQIELQPEGMHSDLLAKVRLLRGERLEDAEERLSLLHRRCTDRRRFTLWPVPKEVAERLAREAQRWGCQSRLVDEGMAHFRLELLASKARTLQQADPAASGEQRQWIARGGADGLPLAVLPTVTGCWDPRSRFSTGDFEDRVPLARGGERLLVLGGVDAETPAAWLRTGEGLSALWLQATDEGISVVPLSQPIEINAVRVAVRHVGVNDQFTPHLLVRIGWQAIGRAGLSRTPRRPVAEVLR